ncbi:glutamine synthetase inactivation factor IF7A [Thermosynechococcus sp. FA-CM-4201]
MTTLTYRGVQYNYVPPAINTQATDVVAKYRGSTYRVAAATNPPEESLKIMTYRGVKYQKGKQPAGVPAARLADNVASVPMTATVNEMARSLAIAHHVMIKSREQTLLARVAEAIGMPVTAAHYWNQIQGKVNPVFGATYDRSHVALS